LLCLGVVFTGVERSSADELGWNPERTWVFAVGILEWQHSDIWASFPAAMKNRSDAQLIKLLRDSGVPDEQIVYLQDAKAKKVNVQQKFAELLDQTDEGDFLIFYFAGHGYRDVETNQTWFATYDAGKKDKSGWAVRNVFKIIDDHFSGDRALLLADCCHSGALYDEVLKRGDTDVGFATFTSSYSHNTSTGAWTFTNSLLDSFRGRPSIDYDQDSYVKLDEAARYIAGEMAFVEGQMSMFTASKKFAPSTKLAAAAGPPAAKVDTHCEAYSEGKWYKSRVLEFDSASNQYKVHYLGWDAKYDEWLPANRVRAWRPRQFAAGTRVEACDDAGDWYPAQVRKAWYGLHLIHYDNYDDTWDEWVGPDRIRPKR
jgi:hypothetical protein